MIPVCHECQTQLTEWDTELEDTCNWCAKTLRHSWHVAEMAYWGLADEE